MVYDAIVVGAGAAGGWCVKVLTARGLNVLLLDAGPLPDVARSRPSSEPAPDHEQQRDRQPVQSRQRSYNSTNCHFYIDDLDNPYVAPAPFNWIRSRQVGGRTLLWARNAPRMSDYELQPARSEHRWPISYADLAPHYDRVESYHGVLGVPEGLPQLPDGRFCGPPPVPADFEAIRERVRARFPDRRVVLTRRMIEDRDTSRYPQHSSLGSTIRDAEATGRLTVQPSAIVSRVLTDESGSATGVEVVSAEGRREIRGRLVILAASTIETVRILLNSATERHPAGLGNSSGTLGHYLLDHFVGPRVFAVAPRPSGAEFPDDGLFSIPRFRNLERPAERFEGGYSILGWTQPEPDSRIGMHLAVWGEVLPRRSNRVTLDRSRLDRFGVPLARIEYGYGDNERVMAEDALTAMQEICAAAHYQVREATSELITAGTSAHELGGARMGDEPSSSVVDRWNRCWDAKNLFVIDGACFATAGWQNPTLTIMAIAARASEHMADSHAESAR